MDDWLQLALSLSLLAIFLREAMGGVARFLLDKVGLGPLWFVPDAMLSLVIAMQFARYFGSGSPEMSRRAVAMITVMVLPVMMAYLLHIPFTSMASGAKIWMVVIAAMMLQFERLRGRMWMTAIWVVFALSMVAILINTRHTMPWYGYSFDQAGVERHAGRAKWAGGDDRLTGLAMTSFGAGGCMMLCALLMNFGDRPLWRKTIVYVVSIIGAAITTSLTPVAGLILAFMVDVWIHVNRNLGGERRAAFSRSVLVVFIALVIVGPLVIAAVYLDSTQFVFDVGRFNSLLIRFYYSWPTALGLLVDGGFWNYLLGLGYGQVGTSAVYAGNFIWNAGPVDDLAVYVVCTYGLVGLAIMAWLGRSLCRVPVSLIPASFACGAMILTVNCENPMAQLLLGFVVGTTLAPRRRHVSRHPPRPAGTTFRRAPRPILP